MIEGSGGEADGSQARVPSAERGARTFAHRKRQVTFVVSALAVGGLILAACGSSGSGSPTTTASGSGSTPATTGGSSTPTTSGGSSGSGAATKLKSIEAAASKETSKTFSVTYRATAGGGSTVTIEQSPPNQLVKTASNGSTTEILYNGKKTYYCTLGSSKPTCETVSSANTSPLGSLLGLYDGSNTVSEIKDWQQEVAAGITGYHVTFTSASFGGQPSECVNWSYEGQSTKDCVANAGVLAYVGTSSSSVLQLTSYSASAPVSDFSLPKGATITTIP